MSSANAFSFGQWVWWLGVVENRKDDPLKLGRVRVRIFGYHGPDLEDIPEDQLMWAVVMQPITSAAMSGIGTSPTGIVEGTHVMGMFLDGANAQTPMIIGTYGGIPKEKKSGEGYFDPNGVYPKYPLEEADTNRLARAEKISETIVEEKKGNLDDAVGPFGDEWSEPVTPYAAQYPMNHTRESESGHIFEVDDTEGAERLHKYHRSGTFEEIHPDGTTVVKVVKDRFTVVVENDHLHVVGDCHINVTGDCHVRVEGDTNIEIDGNCREHIHGNYNLNVDGNYMVQVNGVHYDNSDIHRKITAPRIDLNP